MNIKKYRQPPQDWTGDGSQMSQCLSYRGFHKFLNKLKTVICGSCLSCKSHKHYSILKKSLNAMEAWLRNSARIGRERCLDLSCHKDIGTLWRNRLHEPTQKLVRNTRFESTLPWSSGLPVRRFLIRQEEGKNSKDTLFSFVNWETDIRFFLRQEHKGLH